MLAAPGDSWLAANRFLAQQAALLLLLPPLHLPVKPPAAAPTSDTSTGFGSLCSHFAAAFRSCSYATNSMASNGRSRSRKAP